MNKYHRGQKYTQLIVISLDFQPFPRYVLNIFIFGHFEILGPEPAFSRLGLGGLLGGYSSHGYTSHASLRAYGAQLGGDRLVFKRPTKDGEDLLLG